MIGERTPPTIELWARTSATTAVYNRQKEVYESLREYEQNGAIASVGVSFWGDCVRCHGEPDDVGSDAILEGDIWGTYREFEDWAVEAGFTLEPGFRRYNRTSQGDSGSRDVIGLPLLCMAVYVDANLHAVFPCTAAERVWTIEDGLSLLDPTRQMNWQDFESEAASKRNDSSNNGVSQDVST